MKFRTPRLALLSLISLKFDVFTAFSESTKYIIGERRVNVEIEIEMFKYWLANSIIGITIVNMEQIFELDKTGLDILKSFFPEGKDITIKEIQKRSGYSYEPVHRTLGKLLERKIVFEKRFGKVLVYSLNVDTHFARTAFYLYSVDRTVLFSKKHSTINKALKEIPENKIDVLIIFGSYAKGKESERSDIDVLCVTPYQDVVKSKIRSLKHAYNKDFSPLVMDRLEFEKIKKENKEFWSDLIEYGVIFKGHELFYSEAYLS